MNHFSFPFPRRMLSVIAVSGITAVLISCDHTHTFTQKEDDKALQRIMKTWSATYEDVPFSISLCEDVETNKLQAEQINDQGACRISYVVRSQRSDAENKSYSREHGGGCDLGGCLFELVSYVTGTITMPDGSRKFMNGHIVLGSEYDDDPYAGDYTLFLEENKTTDNEHVDDSELEEALSLYGRIRPGGELLLSGASLYSLGFQVSEAEVLLDKFEELTCGAPATTENDI